MPVVQFPSLFTKAKLWIKKKKTHHLPTAVIMLGFIPKHINHWLGISTNWSTFLFEVYKGPFFLIAHFSISAPLLCFLVDLKIFSIGIASLLNDSCTLSTSCVGCTWYPSFTSFSSINSFIYCLINIYIECLYFVDTRAYTAIHRYKEVQYDTCPQLNFSQIKNAYKNILSRIF